MSSLLASPSPAEDPVERIVGASLTGDGAYRKLEWLSDRIGHRLSGSAALDDAVDWAVSALRSDGIEHVRTEKVMVPHWVRGHAAARIVAPREHRLNPLALGGSVATPAGGIEAEVIEVSDFEELDERRHAVPGRIVLFNRRMERSGKHGYGGVVGLRHRGASRAARYGAAAMLIRSLGTADFDLPHTGSLGYEEGVERIPAAAISAEGAERIHRLLRTGEAVRVHLDLGCRTLPDAESANVLAEIRGREKPEEVVLIGAHLDSWDVGDGAHDDGAGCAIVMETLAVLRRLELTPRRTIRAVLFTNEENGLRGGKDYAERHGSEHHVVAIESDSGGFAPVGFGVSAGEGALEAVRTLAAPLAAIGASSVTEPGGGADISPLEKLGVPVMGLRNETSRYFDYHHTEADTFDKIDPTELARNVAAMAAMAWSLAEAEHPLPRVDSSN